VTGLNCSEVIHRKRKPKIGSEATTSTLNAMNVISKIELYISYSKVKLCLYASRHVAGVDATNYVVLLEQLEVMPGIGSKQRQETLPVYGAASTLFRNEMPS
jgi:hypothetical protein